MKRPQWQIDGENPDYRFTYANERTFLAWIRTALALLAAGLIVDQLGPQFGREFVVSIAVVLTILSAGLSVVAYRRWKINEIAMRHKRALPHSVAVISTCIGVAFAAGLACWLVVK